jgi:stalled ribosome alternative rescue factor ArfA
MKAIMSKLTETDKGRVEAFKKGAGAYAKKIKANFENFEFYTGQSMGVEGMVALLNYRVSQTCAPTSTKRLTILSSLNKEDGITRTHRFLVTY